MAVVVRWGLSPLVRLVRYLFTSRDLARQRTRAMVTSLTAASLALIVIGLIKMPDRCRIEGVVEPVDYAVIHMKSSGFVDKVLDSGLRIESGGQALITAQSPELA